MKDNGNDIKMLTKLMFRLLTVQILIAAVGAINGIISSFFATNFVGKDAMAAVGLFAPINLLLSALSLVMSGGAVILSGKYLGQNNREKVQKCFSINIVITTIIAAVFVTLFIVLGVFDLTGFLTKDPAIRPLLNSYMIGQSIGVIPFFLGGQLPAFLSLENKTRRTIAASLVFIAVNLALNYVFVKVMSLQAFGLALAASLGLWVFFAVQLPPFMKKDTTFKFSLRKLDWKEGLQIILIGYPGALSMGSQTLRGFIVNKLLAVFVGSVGISAFATANNIMSIFWAVPTGMLAVARMIISVSVGEEDRTTLVNCFRVITRKYFAVLMGLAALIAALAVPLTMIFYHDPAETVFTMTVWGVRLLPWCLPLAIFCTTYVCYWQTIERHHIVHLISIMDGCIAVSAASAVLIPIIGINGLYIANIFNGFAMIAIILINHVVRKKHVSVRPGELLCIPDDFGVADDERMDITITDMSEVVTISRQVQHFCLNKGIDPVRSMYAGLSMEEMTGNVVKHGFTADKKHHTVEVRVVHKDDDVILRIKDDCVRFDPEERAKIANEEDVTSNIGIRIVFRRSKDVDYQSILGMNVLTIRI